MNYYEALIALKNDKCVAHTSWKLSFLYLVHGSTFVVNRAPLNALLPEGTSVSYAPHIDKLILNRDGSVSSSVWVSNSHADLNLIDDTWKEVTFAELQEDLAKMNKGCQNG